MTWWLHEKCEHYAIASPTPNANLIISYCRSDMKNLAHLLAVPISNRVVTFISLVAVATLISRTTGRSIITPIYTLELKSYLKGGRSVAFKPHLHLSNVLCCDCDATERTESVP